MKQTTPTFGMLAFLGACLCAGAYFAFVAVQGDSGLFQRLRAEVEADELRAELAAYRLEVARLDNKTRRLSDDFLDLDLLDEQARDVLGMIHPDEIIIPN